MDVVWVDGYLPTWVKYTACLVFGVVGGVGCGPGVVWARLGCEVVWTWRDDGRGWEEFYVVSSSRSEISASEV